MHAMLSSWPTCEAMLYKRCICKKANIMVILASRQLYGMLSHVLRRFTFDFNSSQQIRETKTKLSVKS